MRITYSWISTGLQVGRYAEGESYPITEVLDQIHHCQLSWFNLGVQPIAHWLLLPIRVPAVPRPTYHFVNVFCCTVIHCCCSANAIFTSGFSCGGSMAFSPWSTGRLMVLRPNERPFFRRSKSSDSCGVLADELRCWRVVNCLDLLNSLDLCCEERSRRALMLGGGVGGQTTRPSPLFTRSGSGVVGLAGQRATSVGVRAPSRARGQACMVVEGDNGWSMT